MKLGRTRKRLRGWLSPAGVALVAAFALLIQPFCAPACAARHCAARTSSEMSTHCDGAEEQPGDSLATQRQTCSSKEALPAILSEEIGHTVRGHGNNPQWASLSGHSPRLANAAAPARPLEAWMHPLPSESGSSLFAILRV